MNFPKPSCYLISPGELTCENYQLKVEKLLDLFNNAIDSGISMIQIREKKLSIRLLFDLVSRTVSLRKESGTAILVNDRVDVAIAANADGVHLTSSSIPAKIIKNSFPAEMLVGVSTHSLDEVDQVRSNGADFAVFGPIYSTPSKTAFGLPQGIEELKRVVQAVSGFPVFALGGINETNMFESLDAGAAGIAAIRLFSESNDLSQVVRKIQERCETKRGLK